MDSLLEDLDSLAATGLRLSADDFGTGYSPLTRLTDLPVHELKVDRTFVARMGTEERARAVVHAILGMGKALGMHVVAEGVETRAQAEELYRCGCTSAQGYLFSPPRTPEAFRMLLLDSVSHRRFATVRAGWTNLEASPARG
jgi:EAL domain-containing protein (putative c-di-GMP-specific phosphodiesterase class I)